MYKNEMQINMHYIVLICPVLEAIPLIKTTSQFWQTNMGSKKRLVGLRDLFRYRKFSYVGLRDNKNALCLSSLLFLQQTDSSRY